MHDTASETRGRFGQMGLTALRRCGGALMVAALLTLPDSALAEGMATSNDVERVARQTNQELLTLRERVKELEGKVTQLTSTMGDRRGGERMDTVSEDIRDLKRRLDKIERDLARTQSAVNRLESKR